MNKNTTDTPTFFVIRDAVRASGLKPNLRYVLMTLCDSINTDRGDWRVWPSQQTLAEDTGFCERSIRSYTHELRNLGFLSIKAVKCQTGEYYEYTINCEKLGLTKKGEAPANRVEAPANCAEAPANLADKEQSYKSKEKNKIEVKGTEPSACAIGQTLVTPETPGEKGIELAQNFRLQCRSNENARIGFYMRLGRLHTNCDQFHKPKNSDLPLSSNNIKTLNLWFTQLGDRACFVMNHAMQHWPRLYAELPAWRGFRNKNPLISALDKYGHKELFEEWQKSQRKASLSLVAANLAQQATA